MEGVRKIVEAGGFVQHFGISPNLVNLEAMGSPIYTGEAPYWNQVLGLQQGYSGGLEGQWLPQINYETFGGGFSNLPTELGGQRQGPQHREGGPGPDRVMYKLVVQRPEDCLQEAGREPGGSACKLWHSAGIAAGPDDAEQ